MFPDDFEKFVKQKCLEQRELLEKTWIPQCGKKILELKEYWKHLVPLGDDESLDLPMKFFACISAEMSNQLRNMVVDSLDEFVQFFEQYLVSFSPMLSHRVLFFLQVENITTMLTAILEKFSILKYKRRIVLWIE